MSEYREHRWLVVALTIVGIVVTAAVAYNVGLSQGLAQVGAAASDATTYPYEWHRRGGFGVLFPLMFIFFWLVVASRLWWRPWGYWSTITAGRRTSAIDSTSGIARRMSG